MDSKTIWKFPIPIDTEDGVYGSFTIEMPFGAKILHAGIDPQHQACVWAEVIPNNTPEPKPFHVVGTGKDISYWSDEYIGSFVQGRYVWHLYKEAK